MKLKIGAVVALLSLASFLALPMAAHAVNNMRSGTSADVGRNEVIDASVYLAGSNVTVAGDVRGDVFCAGQNVNITGTVEGDVFCAGQIVQVSGSVSGSVHVAGQTVTVSGPVGHSLTVFGQSVTATNDSAVNSDATIFGSVVQLGGKVNRDVVVAGQNVSLSGVIGRNATVGIARQLTLADNSRIGGDLDYTSHNQLSQGSGVTVVGTTTRHEPPAKQQTNENSWATTIWGAAYWFGAFLLFALLLLAFVPRTYTTTSKLMTRQGGWALLAGIVTLIVAPAVAIFFMVTVIGAPFGIALLLLWGIGLLASFAYSIYALGDWIAVQAKWKVKWQKALALLIGALVLTMLMPIPFVGGFVGFLALVWGLGGLTLAIGSYMKNNDKAEPRKLAKS